MKYPDPIRIVAVLVFQLAGSALSGCAGTAKPPLEASIPLAPRTASVDGMPQVRIPAGEFRMGSTQADVKKILEECPDCHAEWFENELPQHTVFLDGYWIDQTEVTNAMFAAFADSTGYQTDAETAGGGIVLNMLMQEWAMVAGATWRHPRGPGTDLIGLENHPVVQMSYPDAEAYCAWAGRRLPTEAEWEKAARGADGRRFPWGNQPPTGNLLNFADRNSYVRLAGLDQDDGFAFTAPVGSFPGGASVYGALDMAGNVWERVADFYGEEYYAHSPARNPTGPSSGEFVILRGGSWSRPAWYVRTTVRYSYLKQNRSSGLGFRCASSD
jgi:formylglycine-generating enzyme required for sulfatase activity